METWRNRLEGVFVSFCDVTESVILSDRYRGVTVRSSREDKKKGIFGYKRFLFPLIKASFIGSTLVVKIKKTQESTPIILVMPKKNNRDKENIVLLPVVSPLSRRGHPKFDSPRLCFFVLGNHTGSTGPGPATT
jgi:hypothetical protein